MRSTSGNPETSRAHTTGFVARSLRAMGAVVGPAVLACWPTNGGPGSEPIQGTPPRPYVIAGGPTIARHPDPDTALLLFTLVARDSSPHRTWTPSVLHVESEQGYKRDVLLVPVSCLEPTSSSSPFPFNFQWLSCHQIFVETSARLTQAQITQLEDLVTGRLVSTYVLQTVPGAVYNFTVPVGRSATDEAARRARQLAVVRSADRISQEPACVHSDQVPPPPCPSWFLFTLLPYSLVDSHGDTIPTRSGGWIRAYYTDPVGIQHTTEYVTP